MLFLLQKIEVWPFRAPDTNCQYISSMMLEIDFYTNEGCEEETTSELYNSDEMADEFLMQFIDQVPYWIKLKVKLKNKFRTLSKIEQLLYLKFRG